MMRVEKGTNTPEFWTVPCAQCGALVAQPCLKLHSSARARDVHTDRVRGAIQRLEALLPEIPQCVVKSDLGGLVCHLSEDHDGLHHDHFDAVWWQSEAEHDQVG